MAMIGIAQTFLSQHRRGTNAGQVTSEFVVTVLFVILPLMILVPTLGKYLDAKHKVELGARYAAWERTAWFAQEKDGGFGAVKSQRKIQEEVQHRVFNRREAPVYTGQSVEDPKVDPLLMYAYGGEGEYKPVLKERETNSERTRHVASTVNALETPGLGGDVEGAFDSLSNMPLAGNFDIGAKSGSHEGEVRVSLRNPARIEAFEDLELELSRRNMLVADGWNVGGPDHNERRVRGLVPTNALNNQIFNTAARWLGNGLSYLYPPASAITDLQPGHVDVEPVPEQYLENTN